MITKWAVAANVSKFYDTYRNAGVSNVNEGFIYGKAQLSTMAFQTKPPISQLLL